MSSKNDNRLRGSEMKVFDEQPHTIKEKIALAALLIVYVGGAALILSGVMK